MVPRSTGFANVTKSSVSRPKIGKNMDVGNGFGELLLLLFCCCFHHDSYRMYIIGYHTYDTYTVCDDRDRYLISELDVLRYFTHGYHRGKVSIRLTPFLNRFQCVDHSPP